MKFLSDILAKAGLTVDGVVTLNNTATGQTPSANDNSTKLATTAWVRTFVQPYSLPIASASILGGIKVGSGLSIDSGTGVLSATGGGGPSTSFRSEYLITATAGQTTFTVPNGYTPGKIDLFLNGVYLNDTTYTATNSSTVVLDDPAALDDILTIFVYSTYYVGESPSARTTTYFTATNNQTVFTVDYVIGQVDIFYNGSKLEPSDYTANNGTSITLTNSCNTGDIVEVVNWAVGGGIAATRTITIDGVTQDLSANRTWNILPTGGATGDILAKTSGSNYAVAWIPNYTSQVQHYVKLGEAMTAGTAVYVSGSTGNAGTNMIVSKASNATEGTSTKTIGLVASGGLQNDVVFVVTEGLVAGLDTSAAGAAGDPVWLGTNGQLIFGLLNKPTAPAHLVFIGIVTRKQQNNGEIFVKVQNGFELEELHNLSVASPSDGDMIKYVASTGLWTKIAATTTNITEGTNLYYTNTRSRAAISLTTTGTSGAATYDNTTGVINIPQYQGGVTSFNTRTGAITLSSTDVTTALGYTPVTNARTITINGTTYDLSADRSWSIASGVTSFNTRTGAISLTSLDVTNALTFTPVTNARTLTINGTTYDLSANRSWTIAPDTSVRNTYTFTATANQTTFTVTGGYTVGLVDVFINGVKLAAADFTATNGTTVVLTTGTGVGNIVEIIKYVSAFTTAVENIRTLTINGVTYDLTADRTWSITNASLGAQPQLNGTGLVRMSGTTVSYDNATYATQTYVTTAISNLVNAAPSTLDTLNELAAALGNDANFATTVTNSIATKLPSSSVSGTTNYLAKFTGASTIGNSAVSDDGTSVAVGVSITANTGNLQIGGTANTSLFSQQGTDTIRIGVRSSGRTGISLDSSNTTFTNRMWYLDNVGANGSLTIGRSGLDVLTFTNSGNLGLGLTPSSWGYSGNIELIGSGRYISSKADDIRLSSNVYNDGTNEDYASNGFATRYRQVNGIHSWATAPSGILNAAISFTQVMTLNASGNLGVGVIDPDVFGRGDARNVGISVAGASDNMALQLNAGGSAGRGAQIYMGQGGTRYFTISSNATESRVGTSTGTPLILVTNDTTRLTLNGTTGAATLSATDTTGNRNNPFNVLTITANNPNLPYDFFGGSILFRNASYLNGVVDSVRIRSAIYDNGSNLGGGFVFEVTQTAGGTLTPALTIANTRAATFSSTLTTKDITITESGSGQLTIQRQSNGYGSVINFNTTSTNRWFMGMRGLSNDNFYIYNQTAGINNLILDASNGVTTFSSSGVGSGADNFIVTSSGITTVVKVSNTTASGLSRLILSNVSRDFIITNNAGDSLLSLFYGSLNRIQFNLSDTLFPNGVVGIKTTPSNGWGSSMAALQIGTGGVINNWTGANNNMGIGVNFYDNGAGSQLRIYNGGVSKIDFSENEIIFSNAVSSSANSSIAFTTRMRLQANGALAIGRTFGNSYSQTSTNGGTSIIDTGITYDTGDYGGYGRGATYQVVYVGNPNNAGSGAYFAQFVGILMVYTGWSGSAVTTYIQYNQIASGTNIGTLTLTPVFWNGSTESSSIGVYTGGAQIRLKISGYNSSWPGADQTLYLTRLT